MSIPAGVFHTRLTNNKILRFILNPLPCFQFFGVLQFCFHIKIPLFILLMSSFVWNNFMSKETVSKHRVKSLMLILETDKRTNICLAPSFSLAKKFRQLKITQICYLLKLWGLTTGKLRPDSRSGMRRSNRHLSWSG